MHLLLRETRSLDEDATAEDLEHSPADIVFLSFVDSDLLALGRAQERAVEKNGETGTLRLAQLGRLRHPMSVDLYVDQTVTQSRCVVVRLLGGIEYWRYGVEELSRVCRAERIPLALIAGDGRQDRQLAELSTVDSEILERLNGFFREGGAENIDNALALMEALAGLREDGNEQPVSLPPFLVSRHASRQQGPRAALVFYRAHVQAGDTAAIDALADELERQGIGTDCLAVASPRQGEAALALASWLNDTKPDILLNATFFSARDADGASALEAAGRPVLQLLQPGGTEAAWRKDFRGLAPSDLAMQIVLPELDGRIGTFPISFKSETGEGNATPRHVPYEPGIRAVVARALGWVRLGRLAPSERRVAIILSHYPGAEGQAAHAVGLDTFASASSILELLKEHGYTLGGENLPESAALARCLTQEPASSVLSREAYVQHFSSLPETFRESITQAWGEPTFPAFGWRMWRAGNVLIAVQPDRGRHADRRTQYHDPDVPPCHDYIAFYAWLRKETDVIVHLGTHGTLEWLPGKTAALSESCAPAVLLDGLPVIYPFIVNNPGEAACARRRLGAVIVGHLTPPMDTAILPPGLTDLERLIDEYAEADGLDRRRGMLLRREILDHAERAGVLAESGVASGETDEQDALARLDAYLCDVKDLQVRRGLHVFGRPSPHSAALTRAIAETSGHLDAFVAPLVAACPDAEARALITALDGRFIEPGPAGAPTRGRCDVLPTGRNLFTVDPRMLPTASAVELARKNADLILIRYEQDEGEPLRHLVLDLWGSATLRTGGEDLALAFLLMGVLPTRDGNSGRITGFEIVPLPVLDRPRVDVTLRISGLFRDAFPGQIALFDQAVQALAERAEDPEWNPLVAERDDVPPRVFGPPPGVYGTGIDAMLASGDWQTSSELGHAYIDASSSAYGGTRQGEADPENFRKAISRADILLHVQDHAETDLLDGSDRAAHEGGLALAARTLGSQPYILHGDTSRPDAPVLRETAREVARIVRGRLANPRWLHDMTQHDYRGAAEIARGVEALHACAAMLPQRLDPLFDACFEAILDKPDIVDFMKTVNPDAYNAVRSRLKDALHRGLWQPRRNSVIESLDDE